MPDRKLNCSFCGKNRDSVDKLIAGPGVYICNECVLLSYHTILGPAEPASTSPTFAMPAPHEIKEFLDQYIVGHTDVKEMLAVSAYNHYKRIYNDTPVAIEKSNILVIGSTGTGKTLFAKTLAKRLDVPFTIADATTLTESGYVGDDVTSLLERLLHDAEYDVELAQRGIIYIDEIDKKAKKAAGRGDVRDISGEGVQQSLLRLIEGTTVRVPISHSKKYGVDDYVDFDTSNVLFIMGGAFVGIEKVINDRIKKSTSIGFSATVLGEEDKAQLVKDITPEDVVHYGLIPELVGRLPIIGVLDQLSVDQFHTILTDAKDNVITQSQALLHMDGIDLHFHDTYLKETAELAYSKKLGARALKNIVDQTLIHVMYNAPKLRESGVCKITFNKYPSTPTDKPILEYDNGTVTQYTDYKLYRGNNEKT